MNGLLEKLDTARFLIAQEMEKRTRYRVEAAWQHAREQLGGGAWDEIDPGAEIEDLDDVEFIWHVTRLLADPTASPDDHVAIAVAIGALLTPGPTGEAAEELRGLLMDAYVGEFEVEDLAAVVRHVGRLRDAFMACRSDEDEFRDLEEMAAEVDKLRALAVESGQFWQWPDELFVPPKPRRVQVTRVKPYDSKPRSVPTKSPLPRPGGR